MSYIPYPPDGTFLSSIINEGYLFFVANEFDLEKIREKIIDILNIILRSGYKVLAKKLSSIDLSKIKIATIKQFNDFKIKNLENLKGRIPNKLILVCSVSPTENLIQKIEEKLDEINFLITTESIAKLLGNKLDKVKEYIILEDNANGYFLKISKLPATSFLYKSSENDIIFYPGPVLMYDILSSGKNDKKFFTTLENHYNVKVFEEDTYSGRTWILAFFKGFLEQLNSTQTNIDSSSITPKINIIKDEKIVINDDTVTALQLFKCDRYTGFTSTETSYTTKQLSLYLSPEIALMMLVALATSFVISADNTFYFLFFSPEEITYLYSLPDKDTLNKYFYVKQKAIEILRNIYSYIKSNELAILELALNTSLQELLSKFNLDKISFILFKISLEGQTYKIYEQIPITIFQQQYFRLILKNYFLDPERFIENISKIFLEKNKQPWQIIWVALRSLNFENKLPEADNVLRSMLGLYKFVIIGNPHGYYQFLRELLNSYNITKRDSQSIWRARNYKLILESFGRIK
jgi:hypothetical protein